MANSRIVFYFSTRINVGLFAVTKNRQKLDKSPWSEFDSKLKFDYQAN